jgi:hypothetical protein
MRGMLLITPHISRIYPILSLSVYLLCGSLLEKNEGEPNLVLQKKRIAGAGAGVRAELVTIAAGHAQSRVSSHNCVIKEQLN